MFCYKLFSVEILNVFRKNRCFYFWNWRHSHPSCVPWSCSLYILSAPFLSFLCNTQTSWVCPGPAVRADCLREPHSVQDHGSSQGTPSSLSFGYNFIWAKMVFPSNKNVWRLHFIHRRKEEKTFTWWLALVLGLLRQIPNYSNWRKNCVLFLVRE